MYCLSRTIPFRDLFRNIVRFRRSSRTTDNGSTTFVSRAFESCTTSNRRVANFHRTDGNHHDRVLHSFVFMLRQVRAIRRKSHPYKNALWEEVAASAIGETPSLQSPDLCGVPLTIGWWNPVVILPSAGTAGRFQAASCSVHEWTHIRRRDWATATFAAFVKCVFGSIRLLWWIETTSLSVACRAGER
jgi:hypothetical protein